MSKEDSLTNSINEINKLISNGDKTNAIKPYDDNSYLKINRKINIHSNTKLTKLQGLFDYAKDLALSGQKNEVMNSLEYILNKEPSFLKNIIQEKNFFSLKDDISKVVKKIHTATHLLVKSELSRHKIVIDAILNGSVFWGPNFSEYPVGYTIDDFPEYVTITAIPEGYNPTEHSSFPPSSRQLSISYKYVGPIVGYLTDLKKVCNLYAKGDLFSLSIAINKLKKMNALFQKQLTITQDNKQEDPHRGSGHVETNPYHGTFGWYWAIGGKLL